jgi:hypothetical protein
MPVTKPVTAKLQAHFASLTDPRRRKITPPLINFIVIAICAVICGADDFVAIADFGRKKRKWFRRILDLQNGIPSHDRLNAIFAMLSPAEFERCLLSWIQALHEVTGGQVIAIDGKTLRGSFDKASSKSAIHRSAPGRRPTPSAWGKWWPTRRATRSPRSRNCWKCCIERGQR